MFQPMIIDLNCDLGEGVLFEGEPVESTIMPYITSANIACGFHAGDSLTMLRTVELALKYGVGIGAHPGYDDSAGFGRRSMNISSEELRAIILYQTGAIKTITESRGGRLQHVKLHGALYNKAAADALTSEVFIRTILEVDPSLIVLGPPDSEIFRMASKYNMPFAAEAFADRVYDDNGLLVSRTLPQAVIEDIEIMTSRVIRIVKSSSVESVTGKSLNLRADTICVHGDNPQTTDFLKLLVQTIRNEGIMLKSFNK